MKKNLLLTATAVLLSLCGYAQTKGTNALGLGVNVNTSKTETGGTSQSSENKSTVLSLGYGHFIKDNTRIGVDFMYGMVKSSIPDPASYGQADDESATYRVNVSYQQYYPLFKAVLAHAGGSAQYAFSESRNQISTDFRGNHYALSAYGGLTWFASKRFAVETNLLSADIGYNSLKTEVSNANEQRSVKQTSFNLNTSGVFNGLGFRIYFLF